MNKIKSALLFSCTFILYFFLSCNWFVSGVTIKVQNLDSTEKSNIIVSYRGGNKSISFLAPGSDSEFTINPESESSLKLEFTDQKGNRVEKDIGVYLEKNYSGRITITIESNNNVNVLDESHL